MRQAVEEFEVGRVGAAKPDKACTPGKAKRNPPCTLRRTILYQVVCVKRGQITGAGPMVGCAPPHPACALFWVSLHPPYRN
jgi:hypothetical protein